MSILYFPQLAIGGIAQYPVTRTWSKQVFVDTMDGGQIVVMPSVTPARVSWQIQYNGLSDAEWTALATLFTAVQGRYGTFTFLDPTDNLFSQSEDLTAAAWDADPLLQLSKNVTDPLGGTAAVQITNGAQAAQQLTQNIAGPGWFEYSFSIYLQSAAPCTVNLVRSSASGEARQPVAAGVAWTRFVLASSLSNQDDGIRFGLELPPGTTVSAFGGQVEAQPAAGLYKSKVGHSGVYVNSRFDQDALTQTANAPGQYSTTLQITSSY